jgi:hypothetical protein
LLQRLSDPKQDFKREVEEALTGQESEPWEIIYFRLYRSQSSVVERAIETTALMLDSDKSQCLEMICADFSAERTWTAETQTRCFIR